ncbi:hypothetical protein [Pseudodesulfovibrio sp.]|uniref:hypothetical protein n=1 Tax=unclassified Pseudodesulfovibrio TaxID=2661612 RepID=UPI003AFF9580
MGRISFWRVGGETLRLVGANAGVIFVYFLINTFLALAGTLIGVHEQGFTAIRVTSFLVGLLMDFGVSISVTYFIVSACRGKRGFIPPRPVRVYRNVVLTMIALCFLCLLAGLLGGLPRFLVNISSLPSDPQQWLLRDTLEAIAYLLAIGIGILPLLRFGFILPAIVMGDAGDYRRSWRLTRGCTGRLYLTVLLFCIPAFLMGVVWMIVSPETSDSLSFNLADTVTTSTVVFAMSCFLCVLYAALARRERAMRELEQKHLEGDLNLEQGAAQ